MKTSIGFTALLFFLSFKLSAQVLETEDGIPLEPKQLGIELNGEFETSPGERRFSIPMAFQYGVSKRLTLEADPIVITSFIIKGDTNETGIGDVEFNIFYQLMAEKKMFPAIAFALQTKIPTAQNRYIGTGKFDFSPIIIAGKTFGRFSTYLNAGYTFVGKPPGAPVNNSMSYAGAVVYTTSKESILFSEVYGNTSSIKNLDNSLVELPFASIPENAEFSGGETVFAFGYGYHLQSGLLLSSAVSYNNTNSLLFRAGILYESGEKKTRTKLLPEKILLAPEKLLTGKKKV